MSKPKYGDLKPKHACAVVLLREKFGELRYYIFPLARRLRKYPKEFIAIHKDWPYEFFVVRPRRSGFTVIEPQRYREYPPAVNNMTEDMRAAGHDIRWKDPSSLRKNMKIEDYLSAKCVKEYRQLTKQA